MTHEFGQCLAGISTGGRQPRNLQAAEASAFSKGGCNGQRGRERERETERERDRLLFCLP